MRCEIQLLDSADKPWFEGSRDLPGEYILKLVADRKPLLMEKGLEFAQAAITGFGAALVKAVKAGSSEKAIDQAVIEFALATASVESCMGIEDEVLLNRQFNLTVYDNGAVRYDRVD
ncbi:hypothetical protein [Pseudomonas sp. AB6]|uniref:hypothetical protein n=1 Tax=Pseudomonas sp. AB6 TaxID=3048598 RepID=UPI002AB547C2|nr:hypothetical protein [Pseudomonas sp. AB6]MDY7563395.1 hypothetical protein [Pseudomonas sp. AB6]MEB0213447.1 hypothetical protein [Pseudomonas sp. AB6]